MSVWHHIVSHRIASIIPTHHSHLISTFLLDSDPKQSVFLSTGELHHYYHLASLDDNSTSTSSAHRSSIRDRSHARYSHWNNTLEAQRTRKKVEREKKLERIEFEQQKIDLEECSYQEAQRRVVLDRANRLLWQDTDRVKNFHGGLLLASVLKERESQIELQKEKKLQLIKQNQYYHNIAEEDRIKSIEISKLEEEKRVACARQAASEQIEQLKLMKEKQTRERLEELEQGERIKRMVQEATAENEEEEQERKEKMLMYNKEYLRANEEQLELRRERMRKEEIEDEKIVKYAEEKERLELLRKESENQKFQKKQQRFEKMLKRQYDHLSKIKVTSIEERRRRSRFTSLFDRDTSLAYAVKRDSTISFYSERHTIYSIYLSVIIIIIIIYLILISSLLPFVSSPTLTSLFWQENESLRTEAQVREIEKRVSDRFLNDEKKRHELQETIRASRLAQIERKREETRRRVEQEEILTREWKTRNNEMEEAEYEEERIQRENALELQDKLREQMIIKQEKIRSEIEKEYEEAKMMRDARNREDQVFQAYAATQLNTLQDKGKSTIPLQLVLHGETLRQQRPGAYAVQNFR